MRTVAAFLLTCTAGCAASAPSGEAPKPPTTATQLADDAGRDGRDDDAATVDASQAPPTNSGAGLAPVTEVDDTLVNQFVLPHTQDVLRCYRASLKEHPGIEGALVLTWTIEANGSVTHLAVDGASTLKDEQTRSCAMKIIAAIQFPPNARGKSSKGRVPYQFTREGTRHAKDAGR